MRRTSPRRAAAALVLTGAVLIAACSSDNSSAPVTNATTTPTTAAPTSAPTTSASTTGASTTASGPTTTASGQLTAPEGDAFYTPPNPLPPGEPGDIIWSRPFPGPGGAQGYQVLYRSETATGAPVAVSGVIVVPGPNQPPEPSGGRPIITWAHGTTGMGDDCAPSKQYPSGQAAEIAIAGVAAGQGYIYAATDYEGLGPPGNHPYIVGQSEGRNVLDIARAAARLPGSGGAASSPVVVWGHSQGGGAAAFAAELAPTYAPDVDVVGAIAGAPAAEFSGSQSATGGPYFGFLMMAVLGFHTAYPELSLEEVLTPGGITALEEIGDQCAGEILEEFANQSPTAYVQLSGASSPAWVEALTNNTPGRIATDVPIFLYHGEQDALIPASVSQALLEKYCALGVTAYRRTYPNTDHTSVIAAALLDISGYATARIAGQPAPNSC